MTVYVFLVLAGFLWDTTCEMYFIRDWRVYVGQFLMAAGILGISVESIKFVSGLAR